MARTEGTSFERTFNLGLITDFTALNFPENAVTSTQNVVYDPTGRVQRRLGFDYEDNFEFRDISLPGNIVSSFLWREVNGNGSVNLFVVQIGGVLYFYETDANSISNGAIVSTIALSTYATPNAVTLAEDPCQFAYGKGYLFVTHRYCEPFYVSYINNVLASEKITVEIRDLAGLDDGLDIDERPTASIGTMSKEHHYNLFNQGWYFNTNAALTEWDTDRSDLPSNADVWWFFKNDEDEFDTETIPNRDRGNSPAPRGHYIVEAFNIDRSDVSGIPNIDVVSTNPYRPRVCAFFAGRIWYGGVESAENINRLYFSQVIESELNFGRCYQQNDPTSETLFDLLPTDGGVIEVSGAGTIYRLFPFGNSLLVFASNGIWAIAGSQGIGFVANDFSVVKISAVEQNSGTSFVSVDGQPYWITGDAICTVVSQDNLTFQVVKVSDNKIREFLLSIPEVSKQQAVGAYNPFDRTIYWLYRSTEATLVEDRTNYDRILVYNLLTQAFYIFTIPDHDIKVHSIELFKGFAGESTVLQVQVNGSDVTTNAGTDNVIIFNTQDNTSVPVFKYFVSYFDTSLGINRFTFAEINNPTYLDWPQYAGGGVQYISEFTTGYKIHTEGQRFFQPNYIFVFLEELNNESSCYVQGVFDYAESGDTGKWSSRQQIYNSNLLNRGVNFRRLKIRGKGRALQLRFTSDAAKPFTIIGWSIWESANAAV
jgi:hypothetical protein